MSGYLIVGGPNYSMAEPEELPSLDAALAEWVRRRNDWTGRFPCWGDGLTLVNPQPEVEGWGSDPEVEVEGSRPDCIILYGSADETLDGWTLEEALAVLGREDEIHHYVDVL